MPSITLPNGTNGSASCVAELSRRLMNTSVVRPFGTAKAKAIVPRTFDSRRGSSGIVALTPGRRDFRIAIDAELRPAAGTDPEEPGVIVVTAADEIVETIRTVRRPIPMHFDLDRATIRVESDAELIGRAAIHFGRIGIEQKSRSRPVRTGLARERENRQERSAELHSAVSPSCTRPGGRRTGAHDSL